jgi:2-iminobutanoate/2-iminopropanoate deaminase
MKRTVVHTDKVPPARVPLSQAVKIGDWVFVSGQLGMDPKTGRLIEGGIKAETRQVREPESRARSGRLLAGQGR